MCIGRDIAKVQGYGKILGGERVLNVCMTDIRNGEHLYAIKDKNNGRLSSCFPFSIHITLYLLLELFCVQNGGLFTETFVKF